MKVAKESAFRLGRKDEEIDRELPTVGLYGIGMKRAIFKLGSRSHVKSFDGVDAFDVEISPEWLASDDNWDLELNESKINDLGRKGTRIQVAELRDGVSRTFSADGFERDFYNAVEAYYGYIIEKGFHVEINDRVVDAKKIKLLLEDGFGGADREFC